jgi:FAD/FMN-containing dehydrogenase
VQQTKVLIEETAIEELRGAFGGSLLQRDDEGYDAARTIFNAMIDRRPGVIARCNGVADVIGAVRFARDNDLPIAVKGGGHGVPGYAVCEDGVMIDLAPMNGIWVDPQRKVARAQAGATWGELDRETQQFGLALTGGRVPSTGIGGLTLGSGSGWLERKLGLTADSLLSADVVTADGRFLTGSESENEDLFWGLRGGGGNFGIVTSFEYRLHEVGPIVLGGLLAFPRSQAPELVRAYRELMKDAPDDLGGGLAFITAPPEPFVPEEARGKPACGVVVCWTGDMDEGQEVIKPLRDLGPLLDVVGPIPYAQGVQRLIEPGNPPGMQNYWKAEFLEELTDDAIDTLIEHVNRGQSPLSSVILEPLGGALARVDEDAMALGNRQAPYAYHCVAMWSDPSEADVHVGWAKDLSSAMDRFAMAGIYLNYTSDQENPERVRSTYGPKYDRLVALKDEYDPDNVFRLNPNIKPSGKS